MRLSAVPNLVIHTGLRFTVCQLHIVHYVVCFHFCLKPSITALSSLPVFYCLENKNLQLELSENSETHPQLGLVAKENETESYPI